MPYLLKHQLFHIKHQKKETPAEFPGGHDSLYCFLENSWNQELINKVDSGIMVFEVLINETGKADSVAFTSFRKKEFYSSLSSVSESTIQNEVKETVAKMPNWRPRMVKKKPNPSWVMIMLVFPYEQKCK